MAVAAGVWLSSSGGGNGGMKRTLQCIVYNSGHYRLNGVIQMLPWTKVFYPSELYKLTNTRSVVNKPHYVLKDTAIETRLTLFRIKCHNGLVEWAYYTLQWQLSVASLYHLHNYGSTDFTIHTLWPIKCAALKSVSNTLEATSLPRTIQNCSESYGRCLDVV